MRPRPTALLLWLALVLCAPLPFFLVETGYQPVAALLQMLVVTLTLIAAEGSSGAVVLAAAMIGTQVLVGMIVLSMVTTLVMRLLERVFGSRAGYGACALVAVIVTIACTQTIYRTPFRAGGLHATLTQVFE